MFRHRLNAPFPALALGAALLAAPAEAYIGPGAGAGAIAVVLGLIAAVGMAFVAILWYPVKRVLKKRRKSAEAARKSAAPTASKGAEEP